MQGEIYIDVVFMVNFIMNLFVLFCTCRILRLDSRWYRLVIASFIGSLIYCLTVVYIENNIINTIGTSIILFSLPILICFKVKNLIEFIKILLTIFIFTCITGGSAFALFYIVNSNIYLQNFIYVAIYEFPIKLLLASVIITYIFSKVVLIVLNQYYVKNQIFLVEFFKNGESIILKAILDTGNSLYDPNSLKPVVVVERDAIKKVIDDNYNISRIYIPFNSVGKKEGMLIGTVCEKMKVFSNRSGDMVFYNQVLGIYDGKLSSRGDYSVLLNSRMF